MTAQPPSTTASANPAMDKVLADAAARDAAGDPDGALQIYLDLIRRDDTAHEAKYRAGTALMRRGELEEAVTLLRQVAFSCPDHIAARANLGSALLLLDRIEPARDAFVAVLQLDRDNKNALYGLASVLLKLGEAQKAAPFARKLKTLLPTSAAALTLDADAQAALGAHTQATAQYRQALRIDADFGPALMGLAQTLHQQNRDDEAEGFARQAAEKAPRDIGAHKLIGQILLARNDLTRAIDAFAVARTLAPEDADLALELSVTHRRAGHIADALREAQTAWALAPRSKAAANAFGTALAAAGSALDARAILMSQGDRTQIPEKIWQDATALIAHLDAQASADAAAKSLTVTETPPEDAGDDLFSETPAALEAVTDNGSTKLSSEAPSEPDTLPLFPDQS